MTWKNCKTLQKLLRKIFSKFHDEKRKKSNNYFFRMQPCALRSSRRAHAEWRLPLIIQNKKQKGLSAMAAVSSKQKLRLTTMEQIKLL